MNCTIREAQRGDAAIIAKYNAAMARETEGKTLDPACVGPGVQALFDDPSLGRYWVGEVDEQIVGQLMVTYEWSDWRNGWWWWIHAGPRPPARPTAITSSARDRTPCCSRRCSR